MGLLRRAYCNRRLAACLIPVPIARDRWRAWLPAFHRGRSAVGLLVLVQRDVV
jgi:hypothetical protein